MKKRNKKKIILKTRELVSQGWFGVRHNLSTLQMKNKKERGILFKQLVWYPQKRSTNIAINLLAFRSWPFTSSISKGNAGFSCDLND